MIREHLESHARVNHDNSLINSRENRSSEKSLIGDMAGTLPMSREKQSHSWLRRGEIGGMVWSMQLLTCE